MTDDGSSVASGHVLSVQNDLKTHATLLPEIQQIQTMQMSDDEDHRHPVTNPFTTKDVIHSKEVTFKISKDDLNDGGTRLPDRRASRDITYDKEPFPQTAAAHATSTPSSSSLSKFCTGCGWHFTN